MNMQDLPAFRRYYNDHMHSKLRSFERIRWILLLKIVVAFITLIAISFFVLQAKLSAFILFLPIPYWAFYDYVKREIKQFKKKYKPIIVQGILDFINPDYCYYHDQFIAFDTFNRSGIFPVEPAIYKGEDYIMGKIGEVDFEMCELHLEHPSYVRSRLQKLFDGLFFHSKFSYSAKGRIIIIPRKRRQRFIGTLKNITRYGGYEVKGTGNSTFDSRFLVFAEPTVKFDEILTPEILESLNSYYIVSKKDVFASFVDDHFYLAVSEPYQLLDANIFRTNISFEIIQASYRELQVFMRIVEDFDNSH
jgi:hypothetical protein